MLRQINFASRFFLLCSALFTFSACGGGASDSTDASTTPAATTPTDGSQSAADLAGYGYHCTDISSTYGSTLNGGSLESYIQLNSNGTWFMQTHFYTGSCSYNHGTGTDLTQMSVSGTYTVGGTNTTPSTSTKITFRPTSQSMQIWNPQSNSKALAIANWANHCSGWTGSTFSTSASSTVNNFLPVSCAAYGNVDLGTPTSINVDEYNIGYRASSSSFQTGTLTAPAWSISAGSFVSSYGFTWQ